MEKTKGIYKESNGCGAGKGKIDMEDYVNVMAKKHGGTVKLKSAKNSLWMKQEIE